MHLYNNKLIQVQGEKKIRFINSFLILKSLIGLNVFDTLKNKGENILIKKAIRFEFWSKLRLMMKVVFEYKYFWSHQPQIHTYYVVIYVV